MTTITLAPNIDGMLLLEGPFARVPHDELRRQLRSQQRMVERDLSTCSTILTSSAHVGDTNGASTSHGKGTAADNSDVSMGADMSFTGEVSFMSEAANADDSLMSAADRDEKEEEAIRAESTTAGMAKSSELEKSLDTMLGRLRGLKRKLTSTHNSTQSTLTQLEARTSHLDQLHGISSTSSPAFDEWCRTRLDRMLVDWMLRKGYSESARALARSRQIENYVDLELFSEIGRIEASLIGASLPDGSIVDQSCTLTLAWCSENKAALRKIRSTLEFDLRLQEFIELTRSRTTQSLQEAIVYGRRHLLPHLNRATTSNTSSTSNEKEEREEREQQELLRAQVGRAMGLLACGPNGWAYGDLYNPLRWQALRSTFRACALQIHSLPPQPILHVALSAGLSSLKLPACYADEADTKLSAPAHLGGRAFGDERSNLLQMSGFSNTSVTSPPTFPPAAGLPHDPIPAASSLPTSASRTTADPQVEIESMDNGPHQSKNGNCPVCDSNGLGVLAKEVPWSHHANSTLVCYITGKIMDENDLPMALPNGCVYSRAALEEQAHASKDGQTVVCPRTGDSYAFSSLRKVFIS